MEKFKKPLITLLAKFLLAVIVSTMVVVSAFGDTEQAKESFNTALKLQKEGKTDAAITAYQACVTQDPSYVDAYINLGTIYFEKGNYDKALENFKAASEKDRQNADALANLGRVEYQLKKYAEAEMAFKNALNLKSNDPDLLKELGKVYYKKSSYKELIDTYKKLHESGSGDHLTYFMLGKGYEKVDNTSEAVGALTKSIELNKDNYNAYSTLGQIYLGQGKYEKAAQQFQAALKAEPGQYRAAYNYAVAVESNDPENYTANIANWESFVRIAKNNPKAKSDVSVAEEHIKELRTAMEKTALQ